MASPVTARLTARIRDVHRFLIDEHHFDVNKQNYKIITMDIPPFEAFLEISVRRRPFRLKRQVVYRVRHYQYYIFHYFINLLKS